MKKLFSSITLLLFSLILTGCIALKPDPSLLKQRTYAAPAVKSDYILTVTMNPRVERQPTAIGVTKLVQDTLVMAIDSANIFTKNNKNPYHIDAYIEMASQPAMSFGRFNGKLKINYVVKTSTGKTIFEKSVYTEAGSDKWYFAGADRHTRARVINVAKNTNQFVQELNLILRK
ncbi:hypothetical protein GVX81_01325 [[Haemophilus] felis]|uniref:Uncharacterized protein n=1 Tax=[Haemophilus] felis TaxID=123822 RepID=A0A1T0B090_9PAST|nr:hypothetical protein [[Haemophilus] felis]NBI41552.1 hypothetical protein [[Haemophilus] felis]OOS03517.1 hypothetical protein B0188_06645 [[Haemophilus] felis]